MSILKANKKKDKGVFLGAHIPPSDASFLSLYCQATGDSKTKVINEVLTPWVEEKNTEKTNRVLRAKTARRVYSVWKESLDKQNTGKKKYKDFDDFCDSVEFELIKKGVNEEDTAIIIKLIRKKNGNKKGKKKGKEKKGQ